MPGAPLSSPASPAVLLTDRQQDCLALVAAGLTSAQIGQRLGLSPRTVDEHLAGACRALGVRTRIQAVALRTRSACAPREPRAFPP
jgi:DNA-binding CsgD family transcriptional regulator